MFWGLKDIIMKEVCVVGTEGNCNEGTVCCRDWGDCTEGTVL